MVAHPDGPALHTQGQESVGEATVDESGPDAAERGGTNIGYAVGMEKLSINPSPSREGTVLVPLRHDVPYARCRHESEGKQRMCRL